MKIELTKFIEVKAYREGGQPTCGIHITEGKFCQFSGTRLFGQVPTCNVLGQDLYYPEGENPFSRPLPGCPVWKV